MFPIELPLKERSGSPRPAVIPTEADREPIPKLLFGGVRLSGSVLHRKTLPSKQPRFRHKFEARSRCGMWYATHDEVACEMPA